jgi:hypothetical protein
MGIDVYWKDESGAVLGSVLDSGALTEMSGRLLRQSGTSCLRFIDPAGDTCFNQQQIPELVAELQVFAISVEVPRWQQHLQQVLSLLQGASRPHTYMWFMGD